MSKSVMSRIFVTGDMHGSDSIKKFNQENFPIGESLTKEDIVIVLGDFGLVWDDSKEENHWLDWLDSKEWTTMFIDGNHENFDLLYKTKVMEHKDNMLRKVRNSVFHIPRATLLQIDNKVIFCFGGAESVDRGIRTEFKNWWKEELPTLSEMNEGLDNLESVNYFVDYVLTHTCPLEIMSSIVDPVYSSPTNHSFERYLSGIRESVDCEWYFGHYHKDKKIGKNTAVYDEIIELK